MKLPIDLQFCIGKFASGRAASSLAARRTGICETKINNVTGTVPLTLFWKPCYNEAG
ncbi:hypothetical protein [Anaerospora hongkongensis]|uniref:hypothetical protein n=1 Tax=Anaerospora hongkongensis TaxID=244830 RepID=UPI00289D14AA|nr:hypothetical protein [Anaerospora hongkongensis]